MDDFDWDPAKATANKIKHGIGFEDAALALLGVTLTARSPRNDETRFRSICNSKGRVIVVIWAPRDDVVRLISARVANRNEQRQFRQALRSGAEGW